MGTELGLVRAEQRLALARLALCDDLCMWVAALVEGMHSERRTSGSGDYVLRCLAPAGVRCLARYRAERSGTPEKRDLFRRTGGPPPVHDPPLVHPAGADAPHLDTPPPRGLVLDNKD